MLDGLNRALAEIESRLDQPVDVAELARLALTSEYHFRRLFRALAGLPLSEYVRRRRLTVAGAEVLAGERTLLEIAVRYGYGSAEAFARAFRAMHGVGPGEARRTGAALRSQPRMSFRLVIEGNGEMRYRIVEKDRFRVVGWKARVPIVHEGENAAIVSFVRGIGRAALDRLAALSDGEPEGLLQVCDSVEADRPEGTEIDFYQGVVTGADAPEGLPGLDVLDVPAGTWAVFEATGPAPEAFQYLWRDAFTEWFPSNPYRSRPGPELLSVRGAEGRLWLPVERV